MVTASNSKSICGRIFLKHQFMFCFLQFSLLLLQAQSQAHCVSLPGAFCKVESRAGMSFSCLWYRLKVLRDEVRISGDVEMPESYSGSILGERELSVKGNPVRRLVPQDTSLSELSYFQNLRKSIKALELGKDSSLILKHEHLIRKPLWTPWLEEPLNTVACVWRPRTLTQTQFEGTHVWGRWRRASPMTMTEFPKSSLNHLWAHRRCIVHILLRTYVPRASGKC